MTVDEVDVRVGERKSDPLPCTLLARMGRRGYIGGGSESEKRREVWGNEWPRRKTLLVFLVVLSHQNVIVQRIPRHACGASSRWHSGECLWCSSVQLSKRSGRFIHEDLWPARVAMDITCCRCSRRLNAERRTELDPHQRVPCGYRMSMKPYRGGVGASYLYCRVFSRRPR